MTNCYLDKLLLLPWCFLVVTNCQSNNFIIRHGKLFFWQIVAPPLVNSHSDKLSQWQFVIQYDKLFFDKNPHIDKLSQWQLVIRHDKLLLLDIVAVTLVNSRSDKSKQWPICYKAWQTLLLTNFHCYPGDFT